MPGGNENKQVTCVRAGGSVNDNEESSKTPEELQACKTALAAMVEGMRPLQKAAGNDKSESSNSSDDDDDDEKKKKKRKSNSGKKQSKKVKKEHEVKEKTPEEKQKEEEEMKATNANNTFLVLETFFETAR